MDSRSLLGGIAIGAALALILDPGTSARRAFVRRFLWELSKGVDETEVDDQQLLRRVHSKLNRACSHPHALDVWVRDGDVTLSGPILAHEVRVVMDAVATARGVQSVLNDLIPQESADDLPPAPGRLITFPPVDVSGRWRARLPALAGAAALAAGGVVLAYSRR
jgi:hypothetical protein